ncbi:MobA-like NTP transferase domain-containing protein [Desulfotomaculum arcticum]|uniref:MobA-like NTP transferase domain-containing protein n=1 Tax=Desulfotruncus arcticus DSM 17038 TaxID=1121424 RepID=A0A1I2WIT5_9FIRM|nr:nucleotidyltransferase family protein [Desulfotruncus arcticus]SFG99481.1 MobA-like NTP transferase domain-containing protein [Desulfotomaculum arcticum] [Desulfotruncus arcticus DSM 17038]
MIDALVLAGSPNNGALSSCSKAAYEAMITIGDKLMVQYVIEAIRKCGQINRVAIVGPRNDLAKYINEDDHIMLINHGSELTENVLLGLNRLPGSKRVLLFTSDIPLITHIAIEDFIMQCEKVEADLYYPIVPREVIEKRYAYCNRTYVSLKEGAFTGGNMFMFNPGIIEECMPRGQKLVEARKSPIKLCRIVGIMFLIKFLMRNITLKEAQTKVSRLLGIHGQVVISMYPEVGVDVDKPSDLDLVNAYLGLAQ